jgi:hypothetical protein
LAKLFTGWASQCCQLLFKPTQTPLILVAAFQTKKQDKISSFEIEMLPISTNKMGKTYLRLSCQSSKVIHSQRDNVAKQTDNYPPCCLSTNADIHENFLKIKKYENNE